MSTTPRLIPLLLLLLVLGCEPASPVPAANASPPGQPKNVLLITLDTTRADHLGCYGYPHALTRTIDALAARGVLFEQARTPVPLTLPAHTTIMTGLLPCEHGVRDNGLFKVPAELGTLASVLHGHGFATGAFVGSFVLDRSFGLDRGFDCYSDVKQTLLTHVGPFDERPATAVTRDAIAWLDTVTDARAFFAWVHYFDAHAPYRSPLSPPGMHPYDAEIAFVDEQLAVLLGALAQRHRLDDTLVVVTADHGESLGEHGEETHGHFVYDATMHVPLVFAHASLARGLRVASAVGLQDIAPTLLDLLGIAAEPPPGGRSLKAALHGADIDSGDQYLECYASYYAHGWSPLQGVVVGSRKFIEVPRPELYDLRADPLERDDRAGSEPGLLQRARARLNELTRAHGLRSGAAVPSNMDAASKELLTALGYVGGKARQLPTDISALADPKDCVTVMRQYDEASQLMRDGKLEAGRKLMLHLVELQPNNVTFVSRYGMLLGQMGKLDEAIVHLQRALAIGPVDASTWFSLGQVHQQRGDRGEAEQCFRQALTIDRKHLGARLRLAEALEQSGQREQALEHYRTLLELWDGDAATRGQIERRVAALAKP
ncbi:MAG: sulfatase-like hydrolase/transferase [Planctomycetota bacterium]